MRRLGLVRAPAPAPAPVGVFVFAWVFGFVFSFAPGSAQAGTLALSPDRLAVGGSDTIVVYALPGGEVVAELPLAPRSAEWEGDRLKMRLRKAVAVWSDSTGLQVSSQLPVGDDWVLGPHDLVYEWGAAALGGGVSVLDPWTGLQVAVAAGGTTISRAGPDGYIDSLGLHAFDGRVLVAAGGDDDVAGIQRCSVLLGPRVLCRWGGSATLRDGAGEVVWRAAGGTIEAVLTEGPAPGTLLVRGAGARLGGGADWRLVKPNGSVAATFPAATGTWELSAAGLAHAASDHVEVYDLDGTLRVSIPTSRTAGTLARIDVTGLRWLVRIAARAVIADASRVYVAAWEGTIALDAETGALVWAAPGGDAANVTLGLLGAR